MPHEFYLTNAEYLSETEKIAFTKFQNHSSAQAVKLNIFVDQIFNFFNIDISNILEEITVWKNSRNDTIGNISTKYLKKCMTFGHHH